jgi:hypothetical protein
MKVKGRDEQSWSNCGMIQRTRDDVILSVALGKKKYSEEKAREPLPPAQITVTGLGIELR